MRTYLNRVALSALAAVALATATVLGASAQTTDIGAGRTPPVPPGPSSLSVMPTLPPPPAFDILVARPGNPVPSKKCTTVAACDDLISQCYADADNPGDWACHEETSEGQCSTGTCILP